MVFHFKIAARTSSQEHNLVKHMLICSLRFKRELMTTPQMFTLDSMEKLTPFCYSIAVVPLVLKMSRSTEFGFVSMPSSVNWTIGPHIYSHAWGKHKKDEAKYSPFCIRNSHLLYKNCCSFIQISLKFVAKGLNNYKLSLIHPLKMTVLKKL